MRTPGKPFALLFCVLVSAAPVFADSHLQSRIVGGNNLSIDTAPSTVALLSVDRFAQTGSFRQSQFCGGTVIDSRWVLTAAHCLLDNQGVATRSDKLGVLMGSTDLNNPVNQPVGVTQVIVHANYNDQTNANDIALLLLEYDALVPASPPDTQATTFNDLALIAGWGALAQENAQGEQFFPTNLQGAFVRMTPGSECSTNFQVYSGIVNDSHLCAGVQAGGVDSCQGDSGGPLYRYDIDNPAALKLAGIVSFGFGCANAEAPGVYTRVAAFASWIRRNSGFTLTQTQTLLPPVVTEGPVNTIATTSPATTSPVSNNSLSVLDSVGAGSSGWFMLTLLGLVGCFRNRSFRPVEATATKRASTTHKHELALPDDETQDECPAVAKPPDANTVDKFEWLRCYPYAMTTIVLIVLLVAITIRSCAAHGVPPAPVDLDTQPIGGERESVIDSASQLWQQSPVCSVVRTAYGVSRRAYFLESCTFSILTAHTICEAVPSWVEYRFLENSLVQVSFEFESIVDEERYRECVQMQSDRTTNIAGLTISIDKTLRTSISDQDAVDRIHRIY